MSFMQLFFLCSHCRRILLIYTIFLLILHYLLLNNNLFILKPHTITYKAHIDKRASKCKQTTFTPTRTT